MELRASRDHDSVKFCDTTLETALRLLDQHYKEEKKTSYQGHINFLLNNIAQFPILAISLEDLQRSDVTKFRKDMREPYKVAIGRKSTKKGKAPGKQQFVEKRRSKATVNKYLDLLCIAIEHFNEEHAANFVNVVKMVRRFKGADQKRRRRVSDEEFQAILDHIPTKNPADVVEFFTFSLNQGTRRSETFNMTWGDIDLAEYRLTLPQHKTQAHDQEEGGQTRTLTENAQQQIIRLKAQYIAAHGEAPAPDTRIFTRYKTESTYSKIFTKSAKEAGLKNIRLHDLRHEATTRISQKCQHNNTLTKNYTGHKDERSLARYSHATPKEIHEAVQRLQGQNNQATPNAQQRGHPSGIALPDHNSRSQIDFMKMIDVANGDDPAKRMLAEFLNHLASRL